MQKGGAFWPKLGQANARKRRTRDRPCQHQTKIRLLAALHMALKRLKQRQNARF